MEHTEKSLVPWNRKIDLTDKEESRTYRFPMGEGVTITKPVFLIVSDNGHRLQDAKGVSHYVPYGWIHLSWKNIGDRSFFCLETQEEQERMRA